MKALLIMLRRRLTILWLGWVCFALALIAIPISNQLTLQTAMGQMRFVAMDSRDTFYLSSMGSFETAQHIRAELSKMAAETIFDRNPDGFDDPERLDRLFNPATTKDLQQQAGKDADAFKMEEMHQKFESQGPIEEISMDSNTALVCVHGQVSRTWMFNQRTQNQSRKVAVFLRLNVNEDMAHNGRYPLIVDRYEAKFE